MRFAIIIPVYNGEKFIADCLSSLIAQSHTDWVALCVNDGSTDQSLTILEKYAADDTRIKVLSQKNGGVSKARNLALDELSKYDYDWISFLDIDDVLAVNNLSNLVEVISAHPDVQYVRTHCKSYSDRADMIKDAKSVKPIISSVKMNASQYFESGDVGGYTHSCHLSRGLYSKYQYRFPEDMKLLEDQVFSIKFALKANNVASAQCADYLYFTPPRNHRHTQQSIRI